MSNNFIPDGYKELDLSTMNRGAANKMFNKELSNVIENISDINTLAKTPRKITLEIIITPDEDRDVGKLEVKAKSTLAPIKSISTNIGFQNRPGGKKVPLESTIDQTGFDFDENVTSINEGVK